MANVTLNVTDNNGKEAGTLEAPEALFGFTAEEVQAHVPLIHQVVVAQRAAARQGTHAVKNRGAVSGGGRKPWKQKGTGRARQGSIRAPQWYHGGVAHGPVPRDYSQRTPKKMKAADNFTTVVLSRDNVNEWLSVRNIPTVYPIFADQLNTYDVITAQYVVFSKDGLEAFVAAKTAAKEA